MKTLVLASVLCLSFGPALGFAQQVSVEGDHTLQVYNPQNQTVVTEQLDENNLIVVPDQAAPPHPGPAPAPHPAPAPAPHPGPAPGPHPGPGPGPHPGPGPGPHPGPGPGPHPGPGPGPHPGPHPGPGPHPPGWHEYPGWHDGWHHDGNWHPGWWHEGYIFPVWVWIDVDDGWWQCTAFNGAMETFSRVGPDEDQAAYGALYACGGANYQQFGCYIPPGYCQQR